MLPEKFKARMQRLLGAEYESFIEKTENGKEVKGVRINRLKLPVFSEDEFKDFNLTALGYANDGYIIENSEGIGHTPEHHAGIFYMQDPGAMASVSALDIKPGWRVFDACAAPGGKSGQAASAIGEGGFLLSNEYVPKRAKILVSNFERLGVKNAAVTCLDTSEFPKMYNAFFDLVIVDAPCSGEGMFRKGEEAKREWSEEAVCLCAERQKQILDNTAQLVKDGGYLLYSTCTYSLEENEMTVDKFLIRHPDFHICDVKSELRSVTADGIEFDGAMSTILYKTRRFYPHRAKGEGQYVALLKRTAPNEREKILYKDTSERPSNAEMAAIEEFFKKNLVKAPSAAIRKYGEKLVLISHGVPLPPRSVFSSGVLIGEIKHGQLFPSHQFFSAYGELFIRKFELSENTQALKNYLCGLQIELDCEEGGWCVVCYKGAVIGGGKISGGKMNNHYPKGLREI